MARNWFQSCSDPGRLDRQLAVEIKKSAEADFFFNGGAVSVPAVAYAMFWFTKSQLTRFQNASTNFGRALR
jgi:hypothetical protein